VQANAEPDLQQTGTRLQAIVAGLIEGIMQLVVDPLAQSQVTSLLTSFASILLLELESTEAKSSKPL